MPGRAPLRTTLLATAALVAGCAAAVLVAGCAAGAPGRSGAAPPARAHRARPAITARHPASTVGHTGAGTRRRKPLAGPAPATTAPRRSAPGRGGGCRSGDPLANVYHPYRLQIRRRCLTVTGTVAYVAHEDDGDYHVDLALPASERHLLDRVNYTEQDGQLVTEIVPADQAGCTPGRPPRPAYGSYDYGICTGADLRMPAVGEQVAVTGPYVLDGDHGWMEVHPVWSIRVMGRAVPPPAAPGPNPGTATCRVTAGPADDGYPGDYDVHVVSGQPHVRARASDANDSYAKETDGSGRVTIVLWHTSPGEAISVTVGPASCSARA